MAGNLVLTAVALDGIARSRPRARRRRSTPSRAGADAEAVVARHAHLYELKLTVTRGTSTVDEVTSYFAMRKSSLVQGRRRRAATVLNNKPLFQFGPLDQGWWPDGLYTAPTDEALRYDIEVTKQLGFNMARKHVKVEPARWYYWADRLGLLVWQDMPSTSLRGTRPAESAAQFERELKRADRRPSQSSVHRDVGAVQRRLGPVRHAAHRRSG